MGTKSWFSCNFFFNLAAVKLRRSGFVFLLRRLGVILVGMQSFKVHLNGVSQPPYSHLHNINHQRLLLTPASFTPWLHPVSISRFCLSPESPFRTSTRLLCVWTPHLHTRLHHQNYTICSRDYLQSACSSTRRRVRLHLQTSWTLAKAFSEQRNTALTH